jgi:hypothetical protein
MRSRLETEFFHFKRFWRLAAALGVGGFLLSGVARSEVTPEELSPPKLITSINQFWNLSAQEKTKSHPYRIECDVTYYDPAWKNLWIQDGSEGGYVSVGNRKLPIKSGQHIVVAGTFEPPNQNLSFEHATVISATPANIPVLPLNGQLHRADLFAGRVVSMDAFVVRQARVDPEHLQLTLSAEGETIYGYVTIDLSKSVPDFSDSTVRIRGVYVPHTPDARKVSIEV